MEGIALLRAGGGGLMSSRRKLWRRPLSPGRRFAVLPTGMGCARTGSRNGGVSQRTENWFCPHRKGHPGFAPLVLCDDGHPDAPPEATSTAGAPLIEIAVGEVSIRLDAGTSAARIAEIVRAVG